MDRFSPDKFFLQLEPMSSVDRLDQGGAGYIWQLSAARLLQLCSRSKKFAERKPVRIEIESHEEKSFHEIDLELFELLIAVPHKHRMTVFSDPDWLAEGKMMSQITAVGCEVQIFHQEKTYTGTVRCFTRVKNNNGLHFGVELDAEFHGMGTSEGDFQGEQYFECPPDCGMFVQLHKLRLLNSAVMTEMGCKVRQKKPDSMPGIEMEITPKRPISSSFSVEQNAAIGLGERVVWVTDKSPEYGTVKWIGTLADSNEVTVGVEFDNPIGSGTGSYKKQRLFDARPNHASLVPILGLLRAADFDPPSDYIREYSLDGELSLPAPFHEEFRNAETKVMTQKTKLQTFVSKYQTAAEMKVAHAIIPQFNLQSLAVKGHEIKCAALVGNLDEVCGLGKGIQASAQSGGTLESILFTMFFLFDDFDSYVFPGGKDYDDGGDLGEIKQLRKTLVEQVINPLRKNKFVAWQKIKQFRDECNYVLASCNLINANPSEVFDKIVGNIVRMPPLYTLSSGESYNVYVVPPVRSVMSPPNIQHLLDCASLVSNHRIQSMHESLLVLDFGSSSTNIVFPSSTIDVSDLIEDFPRECKICGIPAEVECPDCFTKNDHEDTRSLSDITFCRSCYKTYHQRRAHGTYKELNAPPARQSNKSRVRMELFAIVSYIEKQCVAFVKSGVPGILAADVRLWLRHDGMAEKTEDGSGIPEVDHCKEMELCFSTVPLAEIGRLPKVVREIVTGMRLCFYRRLFPSQTPSD